MALSPSRPPRRVGLFVVLALPSAVWAISYVVVGAEPAPGNLLWILLWMLLALVASNLPLWSERVLRRVCIAGAGSSALALAMITMPWRADAWGRSPWVLYVPVLVLFMIGIFRPRSLGEPE